jgi:uncharacterized membrane protein YecN with MAPEG domain
MKKTLLTAIAGIILIFPFVMVAYELSRKESITTVGLFAAIVVVLAATVTLAVVVSRPKPS